MVTRNVSFSSLMHLRIPNKLKFFLTYYKN